MYALPEQTLAMALHDVERAIALQPTHLSHYQLTLEPNTVFAARRRRASRTKTTPGTCRSAASSAMAGGRLSRSTKCRPMRSAGRQCAHNLNYWRFGDYLGIGAGAHGKISSGADGSILRRWKVKTSARLSRHCRHPRSASAAMIRSRRSNRPFDYMLNALRLVEGFSLADFESRTGLDRAGHRQATATRPA